jgi:hypothetical protein
MALRRAGFSCALGVDLPKVWIARFAGSYDLLINLR